MCRATPAAGAPRAGAVRTWLRPSQELSERLAGSLIFTRDGQARADETLLVLPTAVAAAAVRRVGAEIRVSVSRDGALVGTKFEKLQSLASLAFAILPARIRVPWERQVPLRIICSTMVAGACW